MPPAQPVTMKAALSLRSLKGGPALSDPPTPSGKAAPAHLAEAEEGEAAPEHDWLATLNLVRQVSRQVRQTDETAKTLARDAEAFVRYANRVFEEEPAPGVVRRSPIVLAGLGGIALSWLALLWFVVADDPFFGLSAATPAVTRHNAVTLAQCALFTALTLAVVGVLHAGFAASAAFYRSVLNRSGPRAADVGATPGPGSTSSPDRRRRAREGQLGGRPYVLFADGAVDLETVFGVRSFASLDEARAFIGED
jgi:hypothetical protein